MISPSIEIILPTGTNFPYRHWGYYHISYIQFMAEIQTRTYRLPFRKMIMEFDLPPGMQVHVAVSCPVPPLLDSEAAIQILFSGGLGTEWDDICPLLKEALLLSTMGVPVAAIVVGLFASAFPGLSFLEGLLPGSIVSSTGAAAVVSVLCSKGISLKGRLKPLPESESGSNEPMAICPAVGLILYMTLPGSLRDSTCELYTWRANYTQSILGNSPSTDADDVTMRERLV